MPSSSQLLSNLTALADPQRAILAARYFKTGPGQYAEGDRFLGISVPRLRRLVKDFPTLPLSQLQQLLSNEYHEARFCALLILIGQFRNASPKEQTRLHEFYLANTRYINNWDLVDLSAPCIVGDYLIDKDRSIINHLAFQGSLWEQRIAILATLAFIRRRNYDALFSLLSLLLNLNPNPLPSSPHIPLPSPPLPPPHDCLPPPHDLIQKALGWMLRELGKRDEAILTSYLTLHAPLLPRTTLRYAIEHYPPPSRHSFLSLPAPVPPLLPLNVH